MVFTFINGIGFSFGFLLGFRGVNWGARGWRE
jgi:hypothetical protein